LVRILIIDDHKLFGEALRQMLEECGMTVSGVVGTAGEGLEAVRRDRPDLVLVDIGLPDESGLALGKRIVDETQSTKVVAVTAVDSPRMVQEAIGMGFDGYVTKDTHAPHFVSSIQAVLDGQVVVPRKLARSNGSSSGEEQHATLLAEQLTPREREVLELLAKGASSGQIAEKLSVSRNTVRTHVQSILTKFQVHSRLEAAAFAVRYGLVEVGKGRSL
jgi:two-component system nitrate/nitrite response regulator NarL